jgi:NADH dehydrogenase
MILVAGGTGRLGTLIVRDQLERGRPVRVLTRDSDRTAQLRSAGADIVVGDVRDPAAVAAAASGASTIISAVHGFLGPRGESPATVDRDGNAHLVSAAEAVGADVVLMSVIGAAPDSPMELFRMKYAAEQRLTDSGVEATVVRAAAFAELWIEILRQTIRRGRPLVFGHGDNPISFVSVRDVAALVGLALDDSRTRGSTVEIAGPEPLTFNQLAALVQAAEGGSGAPRHIPRAALTVVGATVGALVPQVGRQLRAALAMDTEPLAHDTSAIRARYPNLPCTSVHELLAAPAPG